MEVRPDPAPRALHRREPLRGDAVGCLRVQRRTPLGSDPPQRRRLHADAFPPGPSQGGTLREAYFVKRDRETITHNDVDRDLVNAVVGIASLQPAEFVIVEIRQMAGHVEAKGRNIAPVQRQHGAFRLVRERRVPSRVGRYVAGIGKVSGPRHTTDVVPHREGGDPRGAAGNGLSVDVPRR